MDTTTAIAIGRHLLAVVVTISVPVLGIGLAVGLVIALFQAVTSLQEQTLSIVPKVLATVGAIFLLMPWLLAQVTDFALRVLSNLAHYGGAP